MKIFNRVLVSILAWLFLFPLCFTYARFQFIQDDWSILKKAQTVPEPSVDKDPIVGKMDEWSNKLSWLLDWILHFPQRTEYATPLWYATRLIQVAINWTLWILSFVALIYMLYCWFLIFSSWSEDKNLQKGKKWISTAAIALAWIWLSWLIVSAMIWFLRLMTNSN
jgi:hypothetical protein